MVNIIHGADQAEINANPSYSPPRMHGRDPTGQVLIGDTGQAGFGKHVGKDVLIGEIPDTFGEILV